MIRLAFSFPLAAIAAVAIFLAGSPQDVLADQLCMDYKGIDYCLELTPDPDTNPVNTDHTVTAAATFDGEPAGESQGVVFYVVSGPNTGDFFQTTLDSNGMADFTYTGDGGTGTDEIAAFVCFVGDCGLIITCLDNDIACLDQLLIECSELILIPGRVAPGNARTGISCFGPALADKTWEEPTPTPSPTPVDVGAGGDTPAPTPTPAQLPDTGGSARDSGNPWLLAALISAAVALSSGALALARRRTG